MKNKKIEFLRIKDDFLVWLPISNRFVWVKPPVFFTLLKIDKGTNKRACVSAIMDNYTIPYQEAIEFYNEINQLLHPQSQINIPIKPFQLFHPLYLRCRR
jgi:hypothetical protein